MLLAMVLALATGSAVAEDCPAQQYKRSSQTPIIKDMVNPSPSENDFELPMPCGGKLILRHVCIPVNSFLDDYQVNLGCEDCRRQDEGFMEAKRIAKLAGAFTLEDLPEAWSAKLVEIALSGDGRCPVPDDNNPMALYFFIGKYEIASWQWQTVMDGECPGWEKAFTAEDPRPKTNISWFEAVDFTRRYTEWLLKTRPELLPRFPDGRYGYIRLPTEAEWEYAARGGHRVSAVEMNRTEIFPLNNRPFSDYAVYTQAGAAKAPERLAWIGIRCPNPLGLFDTAGNASEMLIDPFRFSVNARLHGAAGGFTIKGGSYRKGRNQILPGRREEMPFFLEDGAFRSNDLGLRVVLSGIVTPQTRSQRLRRDWAVFSRQNQQKKTSTVKKNNPIDPGRGNALAIEIGRLAAKSQNPAEKQSLLSVAKYIRQANTILAEKEAKTIDALIWEALFAEESIVSYATLKDELDEELVMLNNLKTQTLPEADIEALNRDIPVLAQQVQNCESASAYWVKKYIESIKNIQQYTESDIDLQLNFMLPDANLDESVRLGFNGRLLVFRDHVSRYRNTPDTIRPNIIQEDIVETLSP